MELAHKFIELADKSLPMEPVFLQNSFQLAVRVANSLLKEDKGASFLWKCTELVDRRSHIAYFSYRRELSLQSEAH
jgi:hypothetical protein